LPATLRDDGRAALSTLTAHRSQPRRQLEATVTMSMTAHAAEACLQCRERVESAAALRCAWWQSTQRVATANLREPRRDDAGVPCRHAAFRCAGTRNAAALALSAAASGELLGQAL
jgi:hypothetical protein